MMPKISNNKLKNNRRKIIKIYNPDKENANRGSAYQSSNSESSKNDLLAEHRRVLNMADYTLSSSHAQYNNTSTQFENMEIEFEDENTAKSNQDENNNAIPPTTNYSLELDDEADKIEKKFQNLQPKKKRRSYLDRLAELINSRHELEVASVLYDPKIKSLIINTNKLNEKSEWSLEELVISGEYKRIGDVFNILENGIKASQKQTTKKEKILSLFTECSGLFGTLWDELRSQRPYFLPSTYEDFKKKHIKIDTFSLQKYYSYKNINKKSNLDKFLHQFIANLNIFASSKSEKRLPKEMTDAILEKRVKILAHASKHYVRNEKNRVCIDCGRVHTELAQQTYFFNQDLEGNYELGVSKPFCRICNMAMGSVSMKLKASDRSHSNVYSNYGIPFFMDPRDISENSIVYITAPLAGKPELEKIDVESYQQKLDSRLENFNKFKDVIDNEKITLQFWKKIDSNKFDKKNFSFENFKNALEAAQYDLAYSAGPDSDSDVSDDENNSISIPSYHRGGLVKDLRLSPLSMGQLRRLKSDEVPAILQTGEFVLSRDHVRTLTSLQNSPLSSLIVPVRSENQNQREDILVPLEGTLEDIHQTITHEFGRASRVLGQLERQLENLSSMHQPTNPSQRLPNNNYLHDSLLT